MSKSEIIIQLGKTATDGEAPTNLGARVSRLDAGNGQPVFVDSMQASERLASVPEELKQAVLNNSNIKHVMTLDGSQTS